MKKIMLCLMLTLSLMLSMFTALPLVYAEEASEDWEPVEDPRPLKYMQPMIVDENGNVIQEYIVEYDDAPQTRASIRKSSMSGIYYKAHNKKTGWTYYGQMAKLYVAGQLAYCLDPATQVDTDASYKSSALETYITNPTIERNVKLYAFYGYEYAGHGNNKYYCAAQELIWEALSKNWSVSFTTTFNGNTAVSVASQKSAIKNLVAAHDVKPSFTTTDVKVTAGQPVTVTDTNGVLSRFTVTCDDPNVTLTQNGNDLTILANAPITDGIAINLVKEFDESDFALVYKASKSQTVGVIHGYEPVLANFHITADTPTGRLSFLKKGRAFTKTETEDTEYGTVVKPVFEEITLTDASISIYAAEDIVVDGTITYHKDDLVQTLTSANSAITSKPLNVGNYYYVEDAAPEGYVKDDQKHAFSITEDGGPDGSFVVKSTLVNDLPTIEFTYRKYMEKSEYPIENPWQSVVFGIYSRSAIEDVDREEAIPANTLVALVHIDKDGYFIDVPQLPEGNYYITELATHPAYRLDDQKIPFTIDYTDAGKKLVVGEEAESFDNCLETYSIRLNKIDAETGEPITASPFGFTRYADAACTQKLDESFIEQEEGWAGFHTVMYGVSYIKETKAPIGYALSDEVLKVEVKDDGVYLNGVKKDPVDDMYSYEYVNHAAGKLSFLKTGPAFTKTETEDTEYGTVVKPVFEEITLTNAIISIYAAEDITVNGTVVYRKDDLVQSLTSTKDAITSKPLNVGNYYYIEDVAPQGYVKDEQKHPFTIEDNGSGDTFVVNSTLANTLPTVELAYTKHLQESDVPIENAYQSVVFGVYSRSDIQDVERQDAIPANTLVALLHIDEAGHFTDAPRLPEGDYYLKELNTHPGYVPDEQEYDFTIDLSDGSDRIVIGDGEVIENNLKEYTVQVNKVDSQSGNPIISSSFGFTRYADEACTVKLDEAVIDKTKGTASFEHIHYGVSYIKETKAPKGYGLSNEIVKVEVKEDGVYVNDVLQETTDGIYSFTYLNTMLPATGDRTDSTMWYIGAAAAVLGVAGLLIMKKRAMGSMCKKS